MTSLDDDKLDFKKLQQELDAAVAMDAKYWQENDAKIRAVTTQKVATYDEFKDLVAASHLKPLDKGEDLEHLTSTKALWNPVTSCNQSKAPSVQAQKIQCKMTVPNTGSDFARDWRRHHKSIEQRYQYLKSTGAAQLSHIFKAEISYGLLGEILQVLSTFVEEDTCIVLDILDSLRLSNRFSLSLQFLNRKEKEFCVELFTKLSAVTDGSKMVELQAKVKDLRSYYCSVSEGVC